MNIRWSPEAVTDFASIIEYVRRDNLSAANRIAETVYESIESLVSFPKRGRRGRVSDTREIVLSPLPFIVVYRLKTETLEIVRVLHGAQRWP